MGSRGLSIGVVGCGIAGLSASALLAKRGHRVTAFERASPMGPVGAGLLVQPTGQSVLRAMGLLDEVASLGARVDRLAGATVGGRTVLDLSYSELSPGAHGLGVSRGVLFGALLRAARAAGATIMEGRTITAIGPERSSGGGAIIVADGWSERFDLVLVCSGSRSALVPARRRRYPWGAMWCTLRSDDPAHAGVLCQVYDGSTRMVGFMPVGRAAPGAPSQIAMFWSVRMADVERVRAAGVERFTRQVLALAPFATRLLDGLKSMDQLTVASYYDVKARRMVDGSIVALGDAAHGTSPQLGQGANLALMDAACLAEHIGDGGDVAGALARCSRERRGPTNYYRRASRLLTPLFQSDWPCAGALRDACFGPIMRVPWIRRQGLWSLAGVKTGIWSSKQPARSEVQT